MSTRATIKFTDEKNESFYIYRHCDGFPEIILKDIRETIKLAEGRWSGSEMGQLISLFFAMHGDKDERIQDYELTHSFHNDESYRYIVKWNSVTEKWENEKC